MDEEKTEKSVPASFAKAFIILPVCLLVIMALLFHKSFYPAQVLFANDFPLGAAFSSALKMPGQFTGIWGDLNWLGLDGGSAPVDFSMLALWLGGPVFYAKFWQPLSLVFLGLCMGLFCRSLKLAPVACLLGGLAAALHPDYFSMACWGQVSRPMALGSVLLALSALQNTAGWRGWLRTALGGLAVGLGIMEGFDIAVLFSLVVGAYVVYQSWVEGESPAVRRTVWGAARLVLVAGFAAFLSFQAIFSLVGTSIQGVAGTEQTAQAKMQKWDWAAQWSLPKAETASWIISGLFGHRMDTPGGGQYWGGLGRDPAWDRYFESGMSGPPPGGFIRYGGQNFYGGIMIAVIGLWALLQSLRRGDSPFTPAQRKFIWFWLCAGVVSLLLAWGRFGPLYRFFYMLPYASTIRNPCKFMHITDWSALVLFAYGVHDLSRRMPGSVAAELRGPVAQWKIWRQGCAMFEKRWTAGAVAAVLFALLGWAVYSLSEAGMKTYLAKVQFDPVSAEAVLRFSLRQAGWFVLFLTATLVAIAVVLSGYFSGKRAKYGIVLLGALLVSDLVRSDLPWIVYWNYSQKYAVDAVIGRLAVEPFRQRTAVLPEWIAGIFRMPASIRRPEQLFSQLYRGEWAQHQFPYHDIQSLDVTQMPRQPVDYAAYESALQTRSVDTLRLLVRKWELTNTRYLLGVTDYADLLNKKFDPGRERFRIAASFNVVPKPGIARPVSLDELTTVFSSNGVFSIIEFTGALPRAKLYTDWKISTNDVETLQTLASPVFNPALTVLVSDPIDPSDRSGTNGGGRVEIRSYQPKRISLEAETGVPAVLLLNDRYSPNWRVSVDGKAGRLLRCNYLMRGVYLSPGKHTVEFIFAPSLRPLHISLFAIATGALLLLIALLVPEKQDG